MWLALKQATRSSTEADMMAERGEEEGGGREGRTGTDHVRVGVVETARTEADAVVSTYQSHTPSQPSRSRVR